MMSLLIFKLKLDNSGYFYGIEMPQSRLTK